MSAQHAKNNDQRATETSTAFPAIMLNLSGNNGVPFRATSTAMFFRSLTLVILSLVFAGAEAFAQTRFDYFYLEAEKCRQQEDYPSAMDLYRHCLDINPQAPEALYNMGVLHLYLRSDSLGTAYIRQACERDANNPYYLETLAALYLNKRDAESAIPVLEKMATLQSRRSDILTQLVTLYHTVGDTDKAIGALNRIELLEGVNPQITIEKFRLYKEKGMLDSAFVQLQTLCDESPQPRLSCM